MQKHFGGRLDRYLVIAEVDVDEVPHYMDTYNTKTKRMQTIHITMLGRMLHCKTCAQPGHYASRCDQALEPLQIPDTSPPPPPTTTEASTSAAPTPTEPPSTTEPTTPPTTTLVQPSPPPESANHYFPPELLCFFSGFSQFSKKTHMRPPE